MEETKTIEMNIPVIGLVRGIWIMGIGAFAFIGTAFDLITKSLLGSLLAITMFGCMFGVSRYFTEEQIKYTAINMRIK
jgi:hypothetical protein